MGISSRDYVRESNGRNGGWGDDIPACKWLIIITVVVFFLQQIAPPLVNDWFELSLDQIRTGQVWRFVTYAFLHDRHGIWHILFNMLGLWWFGSEMERLYQSKEFTLFYLAAAAVSGLGFVVWQWLTVPAGMPTSPVYGASGAVLAAMTLYATHYPHHKIGLFYGLISLEVRWVVALYAVMDLLPVLQSLQGERNLSGVAHAAHLLGILFGWMYRHYDWRFSGWLDLSVLKSLPRRWRQSRTKRTVRVYDPEPPSATDLDTELDRILAKIHEHGSASLTEREQSILTKASQQYKDRK